MQLYLASKSPRRRELLAEIVPHFEVEPSLFEESAKGLSAYETVSLFSKEKAREVHARLGGVALGADTVVCLDGKILGKPRDKAEAAEMLRALSGREHEVYTGVFLAGEKEFSAVVCTKVRFNTLSEELIQLYIERENPLDKAGAYGIQDGYDLVASIEGSYTNVVGLPVEETRALLKAHGGILC